MKGYFQDEDEDSEALARTQVYLSTAGDKTVSMLQGLGLYCL